MSDFVQSMREYLEAEEALKQATPTARALAPGEDMKGGTVLTAELVQQHDQLLRDRDEKYRRFHQYFARP